MEGFSVNLNQKYALSSTKIRNTVWNIQSYYGFFFSSMIFLFVLQEVLQLGVGLYALQLVSDNFPDLGTDTVVVILVHLLHAVVAASICKVRDDGYRPLSLFLTLHFLGIDKVAWIDAHLVGRGGCLECGFGVEMDVGDKRNGSRYVSAHRAHHQTEECL